MYTPADRFRVAATGGKPDRVPVTFLAGGDAVSWFAGYSGNRAVEYWRGDHATKLAAQLSLVRAFPGAVFLPGIWPDYGPVVEASALGCEVVFPQNGPPHIAPSSLKGLDAVDSLEVPDPLRDGLMPKVLEGYRFMKKSVERELSETHGYLEGIAFSMGPADIAALVIGYEQFVQALVELPDVAEKLIRITTRTAKEWIAAQLEVTGEPKLIVVVDDAIGLIKRSVFDNLYLHHVNSILSPYAGKDAVLLFHNCGNILHLIDSLTQIKATAFNYGPDMGTAMIKTKLGKKISLVGGLSPWGPLLRGSVPEVERDCRRAIEEGSEEGGFALGTEGSIAVGTPRENVQAAIVAAEKYGRYS